MHRGGKAINRKDKAMTSTGKPEKRDIHAKVKRIIKSPDLSKCERIIVDSKTIIFDQKLNQLKKRNDENSNHGN